MCGEYLSILNTSSKQHNKGQERRWNRKGIQKYNADQSNGKGNAGWTQKIRQVLDNTIEGNEDRGRYPGQADVQEEKWKHNVSDCSLYGSLDVFSTPYTALSIPYAVIALMSNHASGAAGNIASHR